MEKGSLLKRLSIIEAKTDEERVEAWAKFGFTNAEARAMVSGNSGIEGCWHVGNVDWTQAISAEHAQKLYFWNFGELADTYRTIKDEHNTSFIVETYS